MRTTLDIDDDLLSAAKELARAEGVSAGRIVSRLLRQTLTGSGGTPQQALESVAGFRPFASRGVPVTDDIVNKLRDTEGT
ncbi:MAG: hypothetical protein HOI95_15115 [Chromatiales bacterium]|nr:hypothetical protein [Chromatiales bacterium]